ncbi:hypothetical protein TAMA11512_03320 [Selenomonas sp. TAMA-11512]|uniref:flagellar filament capping protein FliD n=1 Tax=Selenomonas sp. TAMA-11512 TaxID=3095337 RepID=UPI00308505B4|nr:hypothetical protein TAMA11512_03320 [Selenomonas sp. TAMA-11512]
MATALTMAKTSVSVYNMTNGGIFSNGKSVAAKNKAIASLSSSYGNNGGYFATSAATKALRNSYAAAKKEFHTNYEKATGDLKKSLEKLKSTDYAQADSKAVVDTVKSFVSGYNDTVDLLSDVKSGSSRAQSVLNLFSTAVNQKSLASIGITSSSDGTLKLNEKAFSAALDKDAAKVADVLAGKRTGVADKLSSQVSFAATQTDKLYPSASTAIGVSTGLSNSYLNNAVYNNTGAMTRISGYQNVGTLLNMFF